MSDESIEYHLVIPINFNGIESCYLFMYLFIVNMVAQSVTVVKSCRKTLLLITVLG